MKQFTIKIFVFIFLVAVILCVLLSKNMMELKKDIPALSKEEFIQTHCSSTAIQDNLFELMGNEIPLNEVGFLSGKQVELDDSSKYILEVMSINCKHCNESMNAVLNYKQDAKIPIYTTCFADDPIAISEWMEINQYNFDMGMLNYDTVKYDIGIKYTPCFLFIENGVIQMAYTGNVDSVEFMKELVLTAYQ